MDDNLARLTALLQGFRSPGATSLPSANWRYSPGALSGLSGFAAPAAPRPHVSPFRLGAPQGIDYSAAGFHPEVNQLPANYGISAPKAAPAAAPALAADGGWDPIYGNLAPPANRIYAPGWGGMGYAGAPGTNSNDAQATSDTGPGGVGEARRGGLVLMADGGAVDDAGDDGGDAKEFDGGLVDQPTGGRTDLYDLSVPEGSYVLPADVVSGAGDGNTMAGGKKLDQLVERTKAAPIGGDVKRKRIRVAGGEYIVPPDRVAHLGGGDVRRGGKRLDGEVAHARQRMAHKLKRMPGPRQDGIA